MKYYTYPSQILTVIQIKDGSTLRKRWVYFRSFMRLEAESRVWRTLSQKNIRFFKSPRSFKNTPKV